MSRLFLMRAYHRFIPTALLLLGVLLFAPHSVLALSAGKSFSMSGNTTCYSYFGSSSRSGNASAQVPDLNPSDAQGIETLTLTVESFDDLSGSDISDDALYIGNSWGGDTLSAIDMYRGGASLQNPFYSRALAYFMNTEIVSDICDIGAGNTDDRYYANIGALGELVTIGSGGQAVTHTNGSGDGIYTAGHLHTSLIEADAWALSFGPNPGALSTAWSGVSGSSLSSDSPEGMGVDNTTQIPLYPIAIAEVIETGARQQVAATYGTVAYYRDWNGSGLSAGSRSSASSVLVVEADGSNSVSSESYSDDLTDPFISDPVNIISQIDPIGFRNIVDRSSVQLLAQGYNPQLAPTAANIAARKSWIDRELSFGDTVVVRTYSPHGNVQPTPISWPPLGSASLEFEQTLRDWVNPVYIGYSLTTAETFTQANPPVNASCEASYSGGVWDVTVTNPPSGSPTYQWSGSDGLSGTTKAVSWTYTTSGEKSAGVTVTYPTDSVICGNITTITLPLSGSCSSQPLRVEVGEAVAWIAYPKDGSGNYTYAWSGDATGTNQQVSRVYSSPGFKVARVAITDTTTSEVVNELCVVDVTDPGDPGNSPPTATLSANPNPIDYNTSTTLFWDSENADSCVGTGSGFSTSDNTSGSDPSSRLTNHTDFSVSCTGPGSPPSGSANVTVHLRPQTPILVASTGSQCGEVDILWANIRFEDGYRLYRSSGGGPATLVGVFPADSTSYTDTSLNPGTTYTYYVEAYNAYGMSTSNQDDGVASTSCGGVTVTLTADDPIVPPGGSTDLNWSSTGADQCDASVGWAGTKAVPSGNESTGVLNNPQTYVLTCTNTTTTESAQASVTIYITPTVNLSANPSVVDSGETTTLSWNSTHTTSCTTVSGPWQSPGARGVSSAGESSLSLFNANTSFELSCSGPGGTANDQATVLVNPPGSNAPSVDLTADNSLLGPGGTLNVPDGSVVRLRWESVDYNVNTTCDAEQTPNGSFTGSRQPTDLVGEDSDPITEPTTFSIDCNDPIEGNFSDTLEVTPRPKPIFQEF